MTVETENTVEQYLNHKLDIYCAENNETISKEDRSAFLECILKREPRNLGGLTALRGFIYQYYVTAYYVVEMIHSKEAWWNEVIFELLDDITLFSSSKIRFVQVKTVKQMGEDNHLTPYDLYNRKGGLSWLHTLFSNFSDFEVRLKDLNKLNVVPEFDFQFEIATNAQYDNTVLKAYSKNEKFNLSEEELHKDDSFKEKLNEPLKKRKKIEDKDVEYQVDFEELVGKNVEWCMKRFCIKHFGSFEELHRQIVGKLSDIIDTKNKVIQEAVAEYIFDQLILEVIMRTHRDDLTEDKKNSLVFTREEMSDLIKHWEQESRYSIHQAINSEVLKEEFNLQFNQLRQEIKNDWTQPQLRKELIETTYWLEEQLHEQYREKKDIYVYERFLNRLFFMRNSEIHIRNNNPRDSVYLLESLKHINFCLTLYNQKNTPLNNGKLLFKQGKNKDSDWTTFAFYNSRHQGDFNKMIRFLVGTIESCSYSQSIKNEYICFISHSKYDIANRYKFTNSSVIDSSDESNSSITDISKPVIFQRIATLEELSSSICDQQSEIESFNNDLILNAWNQSLKEQCE
ncbi:dsDNA nuclease domain-containing protein [Paenibacillus sp. FSL R7-0297]|uniref:dsDNA nuclease domain-containing protein n=1 Tax=Paenibacillus sp. FSL R7-0297 TaxID=2921680 RepID=UPI0030F9883B